MLIQNLLQGIAAKFGLSIQVAVSQERLRETLNLFRPTQMFNDLIRIGNGDGSYMVPSSVANNIAFLFSPGVANEVTFDKWFASRGIPCYLIDPELSGFEQHIQDKNFHFRSLSLGAQTHKEGGVISLHDWVSEEAQSKTSGCLQIDIEGAEYEVLLACPTETLLKFSLLVIEFHDLRALLTRSGSRLLGATLRKLLETHSIVHVNVNPVYPLIHLGDAATPEAMEVTLVRTDLAKGDGKVSLLS